MITGGNVKQSIQSALTVIKLDTNNIIMCFKVKPLGVNRLHGKSSNQGEYDPYVNILLGTLTQSTVRSQTIEQVKLTTSSHTRTTPKY